MIQLVQQHPYLVSVIGTFLLNNVLTALISNLPAPTKTSSAKYVYWFKVTNSIVGNLRRAQSTAIENSPNWQDALTRHLENMNLQPMSQRPIGGDPPK